MTSKETVDAARRTGAGMAGRRTAPRSDARGPVSGARS